MKQIDYVFENQKYSLGQFRSVPEYRALIDTDAHFKNELQENLNYLLGSTDINKAEGFLLDYIGALVGTSRDYFDVSAYFSYNKDDLNREKYIWFSEPKSDYIVPSGNLQDINFRARIKAKAGMNTSRCTRENNIKVIKNMTFADKVIIKNVGIMTLDITLIGSNIFVSQNMKEDIEKVLGRGVGIRDLKVEANNGN